MKSVQEILRQEHERRLRESHPSTLQHEPVGGKPRITGGQIAEMKRLRGEGLTLREVAARMGCTATTVRNHLEQP